MTLSIRPLKDTERERWQQLFQDYFDFYETEVPQDGFDRVWAWIFDPEQEFRCNVAVAPDGRLIGFVHYQLVHLSLAASMTCYMADLYVDPMERGTGGGRRLIDSVLAFAKARGLPSVDWLTQETNQAGRRLYDTYAPKTEFVFYSIPPD